MSTVLGEHGLARTGRPSWRPWALVLAGLACLYVPTYLSLAHGLWRDEAYAHGPIVLAVFAWLVWRRRDVLVGMPATSAPVAGSLLLGAGLACYLLGRTQSLPLFEVASHIPVIAGAVLLLAGPRALKRLTLPLLFLLFIIPLPGFILDTVTVPLKGFVSSAVEVLLRLMGYGVERSGVVLSMGDHDLLVADACSGLNSIFSLFALAALYSYVTRPRSLVRAGLLLLGIVPIALMANVLRVAVLVLATYYGGSEAAQGIVHSAAGMLVFVAAFGMLVGYDALVCKGLGNRAAEQGGLTGAWNRLGSVTGQYLAFVPHASLAIAAVLFGMMALTALAAPALRPVPSSARAPDLEHIIPAAFADWRLDSEDMPVPPTPEVKANLERIYSQVVSRTYVNSAGQRVMLMVAYGGDQSDALKAHRQEACYAAQGFMIDGLEHGRIRVAGRQVPVTRMHAERGERSEPVTYWFTMGDRVVLGRLERLRVQLANGFQGRVPDGMLVRISNLSGDVRRSYAAHEAFLAAWMAALQPADVTRFVGTAR
ncbi:MAG TPA: EpsI family protein [Usitatibacter sp.]|nr:EpsI family protein [Usitatibacter sp.]